jgi:hypothetical protein
MGWFVTTLQRPRLPDWVLLVGCRFEAVLGGAADTIFGEPSVKV